MRQHAEDRVWSKLGRLRQRKRKEPGLVVGMLGAFLALNLFLFYVFWELMLIPMYFLIGIWGGENRVYAAIKFFLYTMAGSILMLLAILWLAGVEILGRPVPIPVGEDRLAVRLIAARQGGGPGHGDALGGLHRRIQGARGPSSIAWRPRASPAGRGRIRRSSRSCARARVPLFFRPNRAARSTPQ